MHDEDVNEPKFWCAACGRAFRWKPELAGKKAKCKCGKPVTVPAQPPGAVAAEPAAAPAPATPVPAPAPAEPADPFAAIEAGTYDPGTYDVDDTPAAAAAPQAPPVQQQQQQPTCPVCSTPVLATAVMCTACGYNFRTGQRMPGYNRPAAARAADGGGGRFAAETYQQAAKAAWVLPLVSLLVGCCGGVITRGNPALQLVATVFQVLMIVAGIGLAVFAFLGIKRNGPERILVPAIVGASLNGLLIALMVAVVVLSGTGDGGADEFDEQALAAEQAEPPPPNPDGWLGVLPHRGATVTVVTTPDDSDFTLDLSAELGTPVSVAFVLADNTGGTEPLRIDPAGGSVLLTDGSRKPLPDMAGMLRSANPAVKELSPPFEVLPSRQMPGKAVLLPTGIDPRAIARISLQIGGRMTDVPGRFMTAEEKRAARAGGDGL